MKTSVLSRLKVCHRCHTAYLEEIGETCKCQTCMFPEEPAVSDWEDVKHLGDCVEADND